MSKTVFEKIRDKELQADFLYDDEDVFVIKDMYPKAPVHLLIIPKKKIQKLQDMEKQDYPIMGKVVEVAQLMAKQHGIEEGYRLLTNNGVSAGQSVFQLHFHLLGGKNQVNDV